MEVTQRDSVDMSDLRDYISGECSVPPQDALNVLDAVLRHVPSLVYITMSQSFYTPDLATNISGSVQLWPGYHQSLQPSLNNMLINLDVSATAFQKPGAILEVVKETLGGYTNLGYRLTERDCGRLEASLIGSKIVVVHRGRVQRSYRIMAITRTAASDTMFSLNDNGESMSVADYFELKYEKLQNPHLPCLVVRKSDRPVYLPFEVCVLTAGQKHTRRLNEKQTSQMIKFTCQPPHVRSNKISAGMTLLQAYDKHDLLSDFGISVASEMSVVDARVMQSPTISYHPDSKEAHINPSSGTWNLKDKMVAQGITMTKWCVVVFGSQSQIAFDSVKKFIGLLVSTMNDCGVFVSDAQPPVIFAEAKKDVQLLLSESYRAYIPSLILCILPNTGVSLYGEIKRVSDTVLGIATQCVQLKHVLACKSQYCANVALKVLGSYLDQH
jgi:PAZ domain/Mid domain of argonaute/Argonaute linker 1 domain/Argonaute linker 2 domain/Piwi domain